MRRAQIWFLFYWRHQLEGQQVSTATPNLTNQHVQSLHQASVVSWRALPSHRQPHRGAAPPLPQADQPCCRNTFLSHQRDWSYSTLPVMLIPGAHSSGGISTLSLPRDKSTTEKHLFICPQPFLKNCHLHQGLSGTGLSDLAFPLAALGAGGNICAL